MIVLETERLLLRRLTSADKDSLARLYSDPETMRFFGGPRSEKEADEEIAWCVAAYERNVTTGGCGPSFWATIVIRSQQIVAWRGGGSRREKHDCRAERVQNGTPRRG